MVLALGDKKKWLLVSCCLLTSLWINGSAYAAPVSSFYLAGDEFGEDPLADEDFATEDEASETTTTDSTSDTTADDQPKLPEKVVTKEQGPVDHSIWAAVFGNQGKQETIGLVSGFGIETGGVVTGVDWTIAKDVIFGFAFKGDYSDLDASLLLGTNLTFESMHGIIYARYEPNTPWYVGFNMGVAYNDYTSYRGYYLLPAPTFARAIGAFSGRQLSANTEVGYLYEIDKFYITSELSAFYAYLDLSGYTEANAGIYNLTYLPRSLSALKFSFDIKFHCENHYERAKILPYLHLRVTHDVTNDPVEFTGDRFGGQTAYPNLGPMASPTEYEIGIGITVLGDHHLTVLMKYDYRFRNGFDDHAFKLSLNHGWL